MASFSFGMVMIGGANFCGGDRLAPKCRLSLEPALEKRGVIGRSITPGCKTAPPKTKLVVVHRVEAARPECERTSRQINASDGADYFPFALGGESLEKLEHPTS